MIIMCYELPARVFRCFLNGIRANYLFLVSFIYESCDFCCQNRGALPDKYVKLISWFKNTKICSVYTKLAQFPVSSIPLL